MRRGISWGLLIAAMSLGWMLPGSALAAGPLLSAGPSSSLSAGSFYYPSGMVWGDFNGDGNYDIAVTNYNSGTVTVMLGDGNGSFSAAPGSPITVASSAGPIATAYFGGDSNADLAVGSATDDTVTILKGLGDGSFSQATQLQLDCAPNAIATGDFNGDLDQDIAVAESCGEVQIFLGTPFSDSFNQATGSPIRLPPVGGGCAASGDAIEAGQFAPSKNAQLDLAVLDDATAKVTLLLGDGKGGFANAAGSPFATGEAGSGCSSGFTVAQSLAAGDFTGDGDGGDDLAVGFSDGKASILTNNGSGAYSVASGSPTRIAPANTQIVDLSTGRFNTSKYDGIAAAGYWQGGCECVVYDADWVSVMQASGTGQLSQLPGSPYELDGVAGPIVAQSFAGNLGIPGSGDDVVATDAGSCNGNAVVTLINQGSRNSQSPPGSVFPGDGCTRPPPSATADAVQNLSSTAATLAGTVYAGYGTPITGCEFRYGSGNFDMSAPCSPVPAAGSLSSVTAGLTGLTADQNYQYQLIVSGAGGVTTSHTQIFHTPPKTFFVSQGFGVSGKALDPLSGSTAIVGDPDSTFTSGDYSATINWGDGTPTSSGSFGAVGGNRIDVNGTHVYMRPGDYTITTRVQKVAGVDSPATVSTTATAIVEDYDNEACPFTEVPAPISPDLEHKVFEHEIGSESSSYAGDGPVTINVGFGVGTPTFCGLNTSPGSVTGGTLAGANDKLAIFPVTLGASSVGVTLPSAPQFKLDLSTLQFTDANSPDWAASPPNQPGLSFHWDGPSITFGGGAQLESEVDNNTGRFAALPLIEIPLMSISAFTVGDQLINELPQNPLYASLLLEPEGTLSIGLNPNALATDCAAEVASGLPVQLFTTDTLQALTSALGDAAGKAGQVFPGLGDSVASLTSSFQFAQTIGQTICGYADESIELAEARADLLAGGLIFVPVAGEGIEGVVILIDNALSRGWVLVPASAATATDAQAPAVAPSSGLAILPVRPARISGIGRLRLARLPRPAIIGATREALAVPVAARVNRLLVDTAKLRPGARLTFVAARLPKRTRRATVLLIGPGYRGIRVLRVRYGLAGGQIQLPRTMRPGRWILAVVGYANVHARGTHATGAADVLLAVYTVAPGRHHRGHRHA